MQVMRAERIMRSIAKAFAGAVAVGDLDAAEGWLRLAQMTAERTGRTGLTSGIGTMAPSPAVGRSDDRVIIALP
jgi:hypothetical protein